MTTTEVFRIIVPLWIVQMAIMALWLHRTRPAGLYRKFDGLRSEHRAVMRSIRQAITTIDDGLVAGDPAARPVLKSLEMTLAPWRTRAGRAIPAESKRVG